MKEIGLEVNAEGNKHMFMSNHQTRGQNHSIRVANKFKKKWQRLYVWNDWNES